MRHCIFLRKSVPDYNLINKKHEKNNMHAALDPWGLYDSAK